MFCIEVQGEHLVTRQGRAGGRLRERAVACRDPDAARRRCASVVRQRLAEGWERASAEPRPTARAPELEAVLARDPGDDEARLVYADWLLSRSDPLGDLILTEREWERTSQERLLGRMGRLRRACTGDLSDRRDVKLVWRGGTVHRLVVREPASVAPDLATMLARPALRTLGVITIAPPVHGPPTTPQGIVEALARCAPPTVHSVEIQHLQGAVSPPRLLARLDPLVALPAFEGVGLDLCRGHRVHLPRERVVRFRLVVRDHSFVARLKAQRWPRLEHLVLTSCNGDVARTGTALLEALPGLSAPQLRSIELRRLGLPHAALEALLRSPLGQRLERLDLSTCSVDLRRLRKLAARDPHVRKVVRRHSDLR